ncbi:SpvB/TcaC N-terminal domain-containing protein [Ideonella paludis]|uniref:SpvB/TcaC N-terminal domain-containing protein n=1 Tax=Ideonella paludis TaxID=1233411 RepID=UPI00363769B4
MHTLPALANGVTSPMQFAVTESGQATVNIPIQVPRGIAGMEPHLALNYSSGAGNGLLGLGWTLSGISAITRCPKSIQHDQVRGVIRFNTGDRYCLDGQRLLIVNKGNTDAEYHSAGAEYRTFPDSFSRITAVGTTNGSPTYFKVETKAGLTMEFGDVSATAPANSARIEALFEDATFGSATNRWMLSTITDRFSNSIRFVYCKGRVSADGNNCSGAGDWTGSAPCTTSNTPKH